MAGGLPSKGGTSGCSNSLDNWVRQEVQHVSSVKWRQSSSQIIISGPFIGYGKKSKRMRHLALLPLISVFIFLWTLSPVRAGQVALTWEANTEPHLGGYRIYYGTASRVYDWSIDVGKVTTYTVSNLTNGITYYFASKAYTASNQESGYSDEAVQDTCTYSISPATAQFSASGGTESVTVTTQTGCPWIASSSGSWLTIISGSSGSGNGTIKYSVAANTGTGSRTASSTFAKNVFSVTQAGAGANQSSLVIDDGQSGTTAVGTWRVASSPSPYGTRSLYSNTTAAYTFTASRSGTQAVYLWWTTHSSRSSSVPVQIYNGSTRLATIYVNQKVNGGKWNYLGTYSFSDQARVQIEATSGSLTTCADAVKFAPSP